jgi:Flp pilus assembly protein TadD
LISESQLAAAGGRLSKRLPLLLLVAGWLAAAPPGGGLTTTSEEAAWESTNRGIARFADGRWDEAVEAFRQALAASPSSAEARYDLALALYRARRNEEALAALDGPPPATGVRAAVLRARVLRFLGRTEEAFRVWEDARRSGALDTPALWHLSKLLRSAGRPAPAAEVLATLLPSASVRPAVEAELADALAEAGDLDAALAAVRRAAAALAAGDAELASVLGEAEQAYREADAAAARGAVAVAANLLRSTPDYLRQAEQLAAHAAGSPLSEQPLPLAGEPAPGPLPPPLVARGDELPAEAARALCLTPAGLVVAGDAGAVPYRRTDGGEWRAEPAIAGPVVECASADFDQDGNPELVLAGPDAVRILRTEGEPIRLPGGAAALTVFDYDRDGDADLLSAGPSGLRLWRNNRDQSFTDATESTGLAAAAPGPALGALAADLTGDGADELLVMRQPGPDLLIGGLQREKAEALGAPAGAAGAAAVLDCDHDGDFDLAAPGRVLRSDGAGEFVAQELGETAGASRLGAVDLDLDGFADLLALAADGRLGILRGAEACAFALWPGAPIAGVRDVAVAGHDGAGAPVLALLGAGGVRFLGSPSHGRAILLQLRGTRDNTGALGARVELFAGRLRSHQQVRLGTSEIGAEGAPLLLGLAARRSAQWLQVRWLNNTWAALEEVAAGEAPVTVEQSRELSASCPFLYSWDGRRFAFVTDLLGGSPLGLPLARGVAMPSDPDEHVLIPAGRLVPRDGRFDLRVTVELREMLFLDQVELVTIDHPAQVIVATDDGLRPPPFPPFRLYASATARPPQAAADHRGREVRDRLLHVDGRYPDDFAALPFQGYAEAHGLTLDFAEPASREDAFLVLTGGWYWPEADTLAVSQTAALRPLLPRLEIWRGGRWQVLRDPIPFPGGREKTIAVDLNGALPPGPLRLRLTTNLRLYLDRILLASGGLPADSLEVRRLSPSGAELRRRGYSATASGDGKLPPPFDYARVLPGRPYPAIEGFYTRYGDVLPLLASADGAAAIVHHGEEVALSFPAPPPPRPGLVRDILFYNVGWDKDAHPNTERGSTVEPLPFHGMRAYPYAAPERYPWTPELLRLYRLYQTRWIAGR